MAIKFRGQPSVDVRHPADMNPGEIIDLLETSKCSTNQAIKFLADVATRKLGLPPHPDTAPSDFPMLDAIFDEPDISAEETF